MSISTKEVLSIMVIQGVLAVLYASCGLVFGMLYHEDIAVGQVMFFLVAGILILAMFGPGLYQECRHKSENNTNEDFEAKSERWD